MNTRLRKWTKSILCFVYCSKYSHKRSFMGQNCGWHFAHIPCAQLHTICSNVWRITLLGGGLFSQQRPKLVGARFRQKVFLMTSKFVPCSLCSLSAFPFMHFLSLESAKQTQFTHFGCVVGVFFFETLIWSQYCIVFKARSFWRSLKAKLQIECPRNTIKRETCCIETCLENAVRESLDFSNAPNSVVAGPWFHFLAFWNCAWKVAAFSAEIPPRGFRNARILTMQWRLIKDVWSLHSWRSFNVPSPIAYCT